MIFDLPWTVTVRAHRRHGRPCQQPELTFEIPAAEGVEDVVVEVLAPLVIQYAGNGDPPDRAVWSAALYRVVDLVFAWTPADLERWEVDHVHDDETVSVIVWPPDVDEATADVCSVWLRIPGEQRAVALMVTAPGISLILAGAVRALTALMPPEVDYMADRGPVTTDKLLCLVQDSIKRQPLSFRTGDRW